MTTSWRMLARSEVVDQTKKFLALGSSLVKSDWQDYFVWSAGYLVGTGEVSKRTLLKTVTRDLQSDVTSSK